MQKPPSPPAHHKTPAASVKLTTSIISPVPYDTNNAIAVASSCLVQISIITTSKYQDRFVATKGAAMSPSNKTTDARRKSGSKATLLVTLKAKPEQLRVALGIEPTKEESPVQENGEAKQSPDSASASQVAAPTNGDNASDSNAATPNDGTPAPGAMGPPTEGPKKKGVKRSADKANGTIDGVPKARGKPGPKKKPRLYVYHIQHHYSYLFLTVNREDGTIDHSGGKGAGGHKLGPKANQGAINAGLRALDRSGKPCRKWAKGGFRLKSFTGVMWEIHRWTAPPKQDTESTPDESGAASAADSSNKENKENGPESNSVHNSNSGADVEMHSAPSIHASSPMPQAVTATS